MDPPLPPLSWYQKVRLNRLLNPNPNMRPRNWNLRLVCEAADQAQVIEEYQATMAREAEEFEPDVSFEENEPEYQATMAREAKERAKLEQQEDILDQEEEEFEPDMYADASFEDSDQAQFIEEYPATMAEREAEERAEHQKDLDGQNAFEQELEDTYSDISFEELEPDTYADVSFEDSEPEAVSFEYDEERHLKDAQEEEKLEPDAYSDVSSEEELEPDASFEDSDPEYDEARYLREAQELEECLPVWREFVRVVEEHEREEEETWKEHLRLQAEKTRERRDKREAEKVWKEQERLLREDELEFEETWRVQERLQEEEERVEQEMSDVNDVHTAPPIQFYAVEQPQNPSIAFVPGPNYSEEAPNTVVHVNYVPAGKAPKVSEQAPSLEAPSIPTPKVSAQARRKASLEALSKRKELRKLAPKVSSQEAPSLEELTILKRRKLMILAQCASLAQKA